MDKLDMRTPDKVDENIAKIGNLFPNCITETLDESGKPVKAIDFAMLKQELSKVVVDGPKERYQFTWPDKKKSMLIANSPISATLRPCRAESVNFDETENLYIEGDNLDVLKLLQETYLGKVKMIYIDPPYNTGNDFVYQDNFDIDSDTYKELSGDYDDQGNRLRKNNDTNGRFHTDWLNMMYPRLKLARDLLRDDGFIFISIDDNEIRNLRAISDEVFGESNFIGAILWKKKTNGNNMGYIPPVHDYVVVYAKALLSINDIGYEITQEHIEKAYGNPDNDPRGPWTTMDLSANHKGPYFGITNPITKEVIYPPEGRYWVFNEQEVKKRIEEGRIIFGKTGTTRPVQKVFAAERINGKIRAESWWDKHGMNEDATTEIRELFGKGKLFTHPKPTKLLYNITKISSDRNSIILDFFSGSATTAHAVMQLNAEDGGNRKFIMVQIPETTDETSEAFKAGYKNICEIGKERIRRAGKKICEENAEKTGIENLDCGFRVLKLDSSNMKSVHYSPEEFVNNPGLFDQVHDNIKEDRSGEDLLFQVMLDLGIELSARITEETIDGKKVYSVKDGYLAACFESGVTDSLITEVAKRRPFYAVFRDSSFKDDAVAANFEQIFATWSPETVKKVL